MPRYRSLSDDSDSSRSSGFSLGEPQAGGSSAAVDDIECGKPSQDAAEGQQIFFVGPDGSVAVAVSPEKYEADEAAASAPPSSAQPAPQNGAEAHAARMLLARHYQAHQLLEQMLLYHRRKRSFLFLLMLDLFYFLLLTAVGFFQTEKHCPLGDIEAGCQLLLGINVVIDLIGIIGVYRNSLATISFFVVVQAFSVILYTLVTFTPLVVLRMIVFLLAIQVRAGMIKERSLWNMAELFPGLTPQNLPQHLFAAAPPRTAPVPPLHTVTLVPSDDNNGYTLSENAPSSQEMEPSVSTTEVRRSATIDAAAAPVGSSIIAVSRPQPIRSSASQSLLRSDDDDS